MKKLFSVIMVLFMGALLLGCAGNHTDALMYVAQEDETLGHENLSYEVDLGDQVSEGTVTVEYWKAGKRIERAPIVLDASTTVLDVAFDMEFLVNDVMERCVSVQMCVDSSDDEKSEVLMRQFKLPESVCAYTFEGGEDNDKMAVTSGDELILGGIAFDIGDGVTDIDKRGLIEDSNRFNDYDCIVVIRAQFE